MTDRIYYVYLVEGENHESAAQDERDAFFASRPAAKQALRHIRDQYPSITWRITNVDASTLTEGLLDYIGVPRRWRASIAARRAQRQ